MVVPPVIDISSSPIAQPKVATSSHRLPTISASQALHDLQESGASYLSTGLWTLDSRLSDSNSTSGGLERGKITEIWGPSGTGKTALALQTAAGVLKNGLEVLWVDAATVLSFSRLQSVIGSTTSEETPTRTDNVVNACKRLHAPTLSHLIALILHPPPGLVSEKTNLFVIDDLNILVDLDYPRQQFASAARTEQQKWQSTRRYAVLGSLVAALNKLAVLQNLAIIVTTGCSTRMRPDSGLGAALGPGIGGAEWEAGIWNRLVLFRDFGGRFIGLLKAQGKSQISREEVGETGRIFPFDVDKYGVMHECQPTKPRESATTALGKAKVSPMKPRKRTYDEIADSDGEDVDEYGWAEADDDALAAEGLVDGGEVENGPALGA